MDSAAPVLGTFLHSIGAVCAALCYLPQHKLRGWSWQTFWLAQAAICWFVAPLIAVALTIPRLADVLAEAPRDAMLHTFLLGVVYGVGGTAFGLSIRHIGYSLTYAIAIGISCVFGTLTGPLLSGTLGLLIEKPGSGWVIGGLAVGVLGISFCGLAGRLKELDLSEAGGDQQTFSLRKGLPLCVLAGFLSGIYGIAVNDVGKPISDVAASMGAGHWQTNIVYVFANTGAFVTTLVYTLYLGFRHRTLGEFSRLSGEKSSYLPINYLLALSTGCLWFSQFLFYGLGHVRMGAFKFSSWAIHMIMLILFSNLAGLIMREWRGCRRKTHLAVWTALAILVASVVVLSYGNYLGDQAAGN